MGALRDPTLRVTFLSVGQGDAAVVELPGGAGVLVVDGGGFPGDFDPGERLIAPFLRARKILHVDVLALSHPQLDHYGGLALPRRSISHRGELWWNGIAGELPPASDVSSRRSPPPARARSCSGAG